MIIEIEYYKYHTKLIGGDVSSSDLNRLLMQAEKLYDKESDNFERVLCSLIQYDIIETDESLLNFAAEAFDLLFAVCLGNDNELVATVSCDESLQCISRAGHPQCIGGSSQCKVAFHVTVLVIDLLELVKIDHENKAARFI